jgi:AraC family transcriptional regulator
MSSTVSKLSPPTEFSDQSKDRGLGIVTNEGALYIGSTLNTSVHTAHAFKIYIAIEGEFDLLLDSSRRWESLKSIVIAPDRPHKVDGASAIVAVFYLIPETVEGQRMSRYYCAQDVFAPAQQAVACLAPRLSEIWRQGCWGDAITSNFFSDIFPTPGANVNFDRRIAFILEYLGAELNHRVTIAELSAAVSLSPSRLEHLFREQVGISISRYLLWIRIRKALEMMCLGTSLTEVAYAVGFADSAHLSRTFRRLIGLAPSTLIKNINLHLAGA